MPHYIFKPSPAAVLATLLVLPLFLSLGFWQLRRAAERERLLDLRAERAEAAAVALGSAPLPSIDELRYRRASMEGHYDTGHQILLDNRVLNHQVGYFVLTPLRIAGSSEAVLVNRGWIRAGRDRALLPDVTVSGGSVRVHGVVEQFPGTGLRLAGGEIPTPGWPGLVQIVDAEVLSEILGYPIAPYQVLLDPSEPQGYLRHWTFEVPDPNKNRGYALQWFSFATMAVVLFLWFGLKRRPTVT